MAEDLLASFFLKKERDVTYIDIGCLWPVNHSNTYYFYERNGCGVCIDPNPDFANQFQVSRPRDLFYNCGIGMDSRVMDYFKFDNPVFNTFSAERAKQLDSTNRPGRRITETVAIEVRRLTEVIKPEAWHARFGGPPDLMSIDVEGFELEVLCSNDFELLRPRLIIFETAVKSLVQGGDECVTFLKDKGYEVCGDTGHDIFMIDRR